MRSRLLGARRWLPVLLLLLAAALPAAHAGSSSVRLHFHRDSNDYAGWGLHVWGPGLLLPHAVSWDRPLEASGIDAFGIYFDVPVEVQTRTFGFILHRGDTKSSPRDLAVDLKPGASEFWLVDDSDVVHAVRPDIARPFELGLQAEQQRKSEAGLWAAAAAGGAVLLLLVWRVSARRLGSTREQLAASMAQLLQAQNELRAQGERLQAGIVDELTGLPARTALHQALQQALARAARQSQPLAVVFIDLDGFKQVNDTAGHDAGDQVLRTVASRLRGVLRSSDMVGRVGGDEFVAVVESFDGVADVLKVGRKLVRAAAEPIPVGEAVHQVGASVGIALFPDDGADAAALMKAADEAMYGIKRSGKNGCGFVNAARQAQLQQLLAQEQRFCEALAGGALALQVRPLRDLSDGGEAVHDTAARWPAGTEGPHADELLQGLPDAATLARYDAWLLAEGCRTARQLAGSAPVGLTLACAGIDALPALVEQALAEHGVPAGRLLLWLPVRALAGAQRALAPLGRLRAMGVLIGLSGLEACEVELRRFLELPIDVLRLDGDDAGKTPFAQALVALGRARGFAVVSAPAGSRPR
jgi:diguanylate cyclase (GGDEF)-like protein